MEFHIPFTVGSLDKLKKRSSFLHKRIKYKRQSQLRNYLENCDVPLTREEYLAICYRSLITSFIFLFVLSYVTLTLLNASNPIILSIGISIIFSIFTFASQLMYPKVCSNRKQRDIERNLISALQDILVQLNAGIPLFSILVNISSSDYGALSEEFKKAVKKIHAGRPQIEVLEEIGEKNPSIFFRRTLWQISNGMRAGSDLSVVIKDSIRSLNEEQLIQIQNYGNKLNPMIMFYMLISVIMPALAITFLTILSSMVNMPETMTMLLFIGLFTFVIFIQIMFLGVIRSLRPSLL